MSVALRPLQVKLETELYAAWNAGARNVMAVSPTGSGKTVFLSKVMLDNKGGSLAIAHRQELVSQISLSLARNGVRHRIIGSDTLRRTCTRIHIDELGYDYTHPNARAAAASVDTLIGLSPHDPVFTQTTLVVPDESHHVLRENKWGVAVERCTNARGLFVTATPKRADGKGLGRKASGLVDAMVLAPSLRDHIDMGYLTDYRLIAPESDLDLSTVALSAGGDFSPVQLRAATHKSHITGDIVQSYLQFAPGKLGVTFAVDVEAATEIAAAFRAAGVPAEVVSAKTPEVLRAQILRRFKAREVLQLVNVDLFGEGYDLPAIEVVSMGRATQSQSLYDQQFGRALRLMLDPTLLRNWGNYTDAERRYFISISSKPKAIILDHVRNWERHGLPDGRRNWSLDGGEKRGRSKPLDVEALRACLNKTCMGTYERFRTCCPYCGTPVPVPAGRSAPEQVDGNLAEIDPSILAALRGDIAKIDDVPTLPYGAAPEVIGAVKRRHYERQQAQAALRQAMKWYGGLHTAQGQPMGEAWKRFYMTFGTDVATAQALGTREAEELRARVIGDLAKYGIDGAVTAG